MAESPDRAEEYRVVPSQDAGKYVMTVRLSSELLEHLTQSSFANASITFGTENVCDSPSQSLFTYVFTIHCVTLCIFVLFV